MAASRKPRKAVSGKSKPHADIEALGRQLGEDLGKATTPEAISAWLDDLNNSINCDGEVREALARGISAAHQAETHAVIGAQALLEKLERLDVIIADINSLFYGLKISPQEDDHRPEMYVIRAAAAHGDKISGEALDLMNKVRQLIGKAEAISRLLPNQPGAH